MPGNGSDKSPMGLAVVTTQALQYVAQISSASHRWRSKTGKLYNRRSQAFLEDQNEQNQPESAAANAARHPACRRDRDISSRITN